MHVGILVTSALIWQKQMRWADKGWYSSSDEYKFSKSSVWNKLWTDAAEQKCLEHVLIYECPGLVSFKENKTK